MLDAFTISNSYNSLYKDPPPGSMIVSMSTRIDLTRSLNTGGDTERTLHYTDLTSDTFTIEVNWTLIPFVLVEFNF